MSMTMNTGDGDSAAMLAAFSITPRSARVQSASDTPTTTTPNPLGLNVNNVNGSTESEPSGAIQPWMEDNFPSNLTGAVRPREDDEFLGYARPHDAGQLLCANAQEKAKKNGLTSEQVEDVLAFCDLSPVGMLVNLKIHYICTENDILKRFLHMFIRLRHVVAAALLAPNIPAYVEGTSAQVQMYVKDNVEKLLGVSSSCRWDPADWMLVKTAIVAKLTGMRATIKEKTKLSIKKGLDIYDLTFSLMMYGMRLKDAHWGRFAFLHQLTVTYNGLSTKQKKKGEYWQFIDKSLRGVHEQAYTKHATNASGRQLLETTFLAAVLSADIENFPITSGAIAQAVYMNDKLLELQLETERVVGCFFVNDKSLATPQDASANGGNGDGADGGAEAGMQPRDT